MQASFLAHKPHQSKAPSGGEAARGLCAKAGEASAGDFGPCGQRKLGLLPFLLTISGGFRPGSQQKQDF